MRQFFIAGIPRPKGSFKTLLNFAFRAWLIKKGINLKAWKGAQTIGFWQNNDALKAWKYQVDYVLKQIPKDPYDGAVAIDLLFMMPRPKSHYKKSGGLTKSAARYPQTKPDEDKLQRALRDLLEGHLYSNDSRIVDSNVSKRYAESPDKAGVYILVSKKTDTDNKEDRLNTLFNI